jgi:hypothetical protein
MTPIVADAELARQIEAATGPVQIVNEQGTMIGFCMPVSQTQPKPYTPEEIEIRRKQIARMREEARTHPEKCKSLRDIMANLHRMAGEGA